MNSTNIIFELSKAEKDWWSKTIKKFRSQIVKEPRFYAKHVLNQKGITSEELSKNVENLLLETRESVWQMYVEDETKFHSEVLSHLIKTRDIPREILNGLVKSEISSIDPENTSIEKLAEKVAMIVGEYAGRVMPYIYYLSLSTTNSRRSRAGTTFEHIIETFMDILGYPYKDQSALGTTFFRNTGLGKKVDLIVPGPDEYVKNRAKCAVITMKTSLRERWQEVAEELSRTNVPHIYLLTADNNLTPNAINTMKHYNITVVVYRTEKDTKFTELDNVQDFTTFFLQEIPHIISYWKT